MARAKKARKKSGTPKTFAQLLGVKEGDQVVCLHAKEQLITRLRSQLPPYARLHQVVPDDLAPNMVIRFFNEHADFDSSFRWLERRLAPGGSVWGIIPKKTALRAGQHDLRSEMVGAAKRAALAETKCVSFSLTEIAVRFTKKK